MTLRPEYLEEQGDALSGAATEELELAEVEAQAVAVAAAPAEWWEHAYAGGPPVGPAKLVRALYWKGNPAGKPKSDDGPDVLAVKRAVCRGGRWAGPMSRFDDTFSKAFAKGSGPDVLESGLAGFQRQMRIEPDSGYLGDATYQALRYARVPDGFPHAGEPLFDSYAVELLEQAAKPKADPEKVRAAIADYCRRCIANEPGWHYEQYRAMRSLGRSPEAGGTSDCSEHATAAYFWAKKQTGIAVPDPNGRNYDGYGYTGTLVHNPAVSSPYKIGDLAIYGSSEGSTEHVCTCYVAGDANSSKWCSHGSDAAPYSVALRYRSDLFRVVRPKLVP